MKTALQLLQEGRATVADPSKWTRKAFARNANGEAVSILAPSACKWCSVGALMLAKGEQASKNNENLGLEYSRAYRALDLAAFKHQNVPIVGCNDTSTHADVLKMWDTAIKMVQS